MKILITGGRYWSDRDKISNALFDASAPGDIIIEGGAPGADTIARQVCDWMRPRRRWIELRADWELYGKAAGPIRNREMLDLQPEIVLAFHEDLANSRGTKDCAEEAIRRGIPVAVYE